MRQHFEKDALAPTLDYAHSVPLISHSSSLWDETHPEGKSQLAHLQPALVVPCQGIHIHRKALGIDG